MMVMTNGGVTIQYSVPVSSDPVRPGDGGVWRGDLTCQWKVALTSSGDWSHQAVEPTIVTKWRRYIHYSDIGIPIDDILTKLSIDESKPDWWW